MAGTLLRTVGHPRLRARFLRALRPAPGHPPRYPRDLGALRRRAQRVDADHRAGEPLRGAILRDGNRLPLGAEGPRSPRHRGLRRRALPHRTLAPRQSELCRQAHRHHRHRLVRDSVDPRHRAGGETPHRVPAHAQLQHTGLAGSADRRRGSANQGRLREVPRDLPQLDLRRFRRRERHGAPGRNARGARTRTRETLATGRIQLPVRVHRRPHRPGCQRDRGGVRPRQDPGAREGSRSGRNAVSAGPSLRHEAPVRGHRLLRDLQPRERHAGRPAPHPDREDRPERGADEQRPNSSSMPWCSPPASTR